MTIWSTEIKELEKLVKTDDKNIVLVYARDALR
jgi:hypothetical protein